MYSFSVSVSFEVIPGAFRYSRRTLLQPPPVATDCNRTSTCSTTAANVATERQISLRQLCMPKRFVWMQLWWLQTTSSMNVCSSRRCCAATQGAYVARRRRNRAPRNKKKQEVSLRQQATVSIVWVNLVLIGICLGRCVLGARHLPAIALF